MRYLIRLGIVWLTRQFTRISALIVAENNRYMMTKLQSCGAKVHFHGKVTIVGATNIKLGDNVHLGNNSYLDGRGGITIGENTHISRNSLMMMFTNSSQLILVAMSGLAPMW